jgi:plastocyanin
MGDAFYPIGIGLTVLAVVVSFIGLRYKNFPASRGLMVAGIGVFVVLVLGAMATAWENAELEQDHRENEEAEEAAEEAELEKEAEQAEEVGQEGGGAAGEQLEEDEGAAGQSGGTLELSSPEDGSLVFDPDTLEASAGEVAIEYTNPSSVPHNVHVELDGEELAASEDVADGESTEASADLEAGEYTYFCSIPGHREGGMEGTLTVE